MQTRPDTKDKATPGQELENLARANPRSYHARPEPLTATERALVATERPTRGQTLETQQTHPNNGDRTMATQNATRPHPRTVAEAWPSQWLKAEDLKAPALVTIAAIDWPEIYNQATREKEIRAAVRFTYRKSDGREIELEKRLILNKTQALAIAEITGSDAFDAWTGATIQLSPGRAHTGRPTITISRPPQAPHQNGHTPEATPDQGEL